MQNLLKLLNRLFVENWGIKLAAGIVAAVLWYLANAPQ